MNYNYPYYPNPYGSYQPSQSAQAYQAQPNSQGGFIGVQNENEARLYPVAPGNSVTFRDESQPNTFYTKTMGNSPLDRPTFECYRLVKVDMAENASQAAETAPKKEDIDLSAYVLKTDLQPFEGDIAAIKKDIAVLKERTRKKPVREVDYDDE